MEAIGIEASAQEPDQEEEQAGDFQKHFGAGLEFQKPCLKLAELGGGNLCGDDIA